MDQKSLNTDWSGEAWKVVCKYFIQVHLQAMISKDLHQLQHITVEFRFVAYLLVNNVFLIEMWLLHFSTKCEGLLCFLLQAGNVAGIGLFGDTAVITTPPSIPAAVVDLQVVDEELLETPLPSSSECLALQWTEPCCNGSDITGYTIEYGEKQQISVENVTSCILTNLIPDRTYR